MRTLPWVVAAVGTAVATYYLMNQPGLQHATGSDSVEGAADKTSLWGSKQRIKGAGSSLMGKVKHGLGRATGNDSLAGKGLVDQAAGSISDAVGATAQAAGRTLHDFNR